MDISIQELRGITEGFKVSPVFAQTVIADFFAWVTGFDETKAIGSYELLQEYISSWVSADRAEVVAGDFASYLLASLIIVHAYTKNPSWLDYEAPGGMVRERRVRGLFDLTADGAAKFDQYFFQFATFRHQCGHERDS